jgi:hypothetical protein
MANLTKESSRAIILSRDIIKGQDSVVVDLFVTSVNTHENKTLINFKGCTQKQYATALNLWRDEAYDDSANENLTYSVFTDSKKYIPQTGELVKVVMKSVLCRDGAMDLRPQACSPIASTATAKGNASDFEDDSE